MGSIIIFLGAIGFIAFLMWIGALVEVLRQEFSEPLLKIMWFLLIFILPIIGPLAYFLLGREKPKYKGRLA